MAASCEWVREWLPDFVAGDLPPPETAAVEQHLDGCAACRRERRLINRVLEAAGVVPEEPLPPDFAERVMLEVRGEAAGARRRVWPRRLALLVAAAMLLTAASVLWGPLGPAQPRPAASAALTEMLAGLDGAAARAAGGGRDALDLVAALAPWEWATDITAAPGPPPAISLDDEVGPLRADLAETAGEISRFLRRAGESVPWL